MKPARKFISLLLLIFLFNNAESSDFGIYEKVVKNATGTPEEITNAIAGSVESSHFILLNKMEMHTPNLIRQDKSKHSTFQAFVVLATSEKFDSLLVKLGNRYAANWILRIGVYQDENGTQVSITNPETMTRIICNDLNDKDYQTVINASHLVKKNLRKVILSSVTGEKVSVQMPPVRSKERIRKAKKDMMMMVGPMTFFKNRNQFPVLQEKPIGENAQTTFEKVLSEVEENINKFQYTEKDANYHWTSNPYIDLKWQKVCTVKIDGFNAAVIGLTRNRTEAISFHICGMKLAAELHYVQLKN